MKPLIILDIGFYKDNQAYIDFEYMPSEMLLQFQNVLLFTCYTLRQMSNIDPNHPICQSLANKLYSLQQEDVGSPLQITVAPPDPSIFKPGGVEQVTVSTRDIQIVERREDADKRFSVRLEYEDKKLGFKLNPYGIGPLGKGINYYVPVSIIILLEILAIKDKKPDTAFYLAAKRCGEVVINQKLEMGNCLDLAFFVAKSVYE